MFSFTPTLCLASNLNFLYSLVVRCSLNHKFVKQQTTMICVIFFPALSWDQKPCSVKKEPKKSHKKRARKMATVKVPLMMNLAVHCTAGLHNFFLEEKK